MGVPKFYRWLSERYPCLSQVIKEHQIPEFDNLYLDMNGIIHPCSHPNDNDVHFRITDVTIFKNIFNYIEVLFRIIKPKKNFFMAVDGCAPRAKMNQQRSRRFRTAKDAEDNIRKALMSGQKLPTEERFDSNCITPGTEFMFKLQEQLKYFINQKISTDPLWQNCNIYLSGHNVPGEGEHKIMDFIRYCKSQPDYDVNTRHCLYGLDADLIILGMVTHEPNFALLREEVRYGKDQKQMVRPEEQTFHLLHLTLLREYLDFEFQALKPDLHFPYNIERIIDDWVILGFLVGNDFVPHLPNLHIKNDALPYLFGIYKDYLKTADGYINDGGHLNPHRLKKFFEVLSKFDREHFEDIYSDLKWLESKGSGDMLHKDKKDDQFKTPTKKFSELLKLTSSQAEESPMKDINPYDVSGLEDFYNSPSPVKASKPVAAVAENDDDVEVEDEETFELEFKQHKRHYYMEKYDLDIVDDDTIKKICWEYVRALQWISHYYFNGLQSWSWYYPYHYSPCISDVANLEAKEIEYDLAQPFRPFEQLLAVLPAASRKLLPSAFQNLMVEENSPIIDFYPPDFQTDLNGKQQDWEAVVLIPFINEARLMTAMNAHYSSLTDEEKGRNSFGECYRYRYDKTLNFNYPSAYADVFEDINVCKAKCDMLHRDLHRLDVLQIKKGLLKGALVDTYFQGFPTMKHLQVRASLRKANVKVFQQHSRNDNMVIKLLPQPTPNMETLAKQLVGEVVYVEWPYMVEAMVTSICNDSIRYYLDEKDGNELVSKAVKGAEFNHLKAEMKRVGSELMSRRGVELGPVEVLVETKLLMGQRYICESSGAVRLEKEWRTTPNCYALQTAVQNLNVHPSEVEVYDSIDKLYPPASLVFMLSSAHYGCSGEVIETVNNVRVRVMLKVMPEPDFTDAIQNYGSLSIHYFPDKTIAQRLGITPHLLGRVTGNIYVVPEGSDNQKNIGLKLKYSGQNKEVLGFARRTDQGWTYSPTTIEILKEYMNRFPEVFESLGRISNNDHYSLKQLCPGKTNAYLDEIMDFLRSQKSHNVQPVRCGSNILDHPVVEEIEKAVTKAKNLDGEKKVVKVKAKPHLLYRPTEQAGTIYADPNTEFLLFDRVVNIQYGIAVPIGLRGTIIGFHDVLTDENDKESATETRYEILFDEPFLSEKGGSYKRGYFMAGHSLLNISYGLRIETKKSGNPLPSPSTFQSKISHAPQTITPGSNQGTPRYGNKNGNNQSTPKRNGNYSGNRNERGSHSGNRSNNNNNSNNKNDDLVSPDYWLKGSYSNNSNNRNNYQSPQQPQPRRQILQHTPNSHQGNQNRYSQGNDDSDFINMWSAMKTQNEPSKTPSASNQGEAIDKDATAKLQQMLKISSQPSQPKPQQQQGTHKQQHTSQRDSLLGNPLQQQQQHKQQPKQPHQQQQQPQMMKGGGNPPLLNLLAQQNAGMPTAVPPGYFQQLPPGLSLFGAQANAQASAAAAAGLQSPNIFQQLCNSNNLPTQQQQQQQQQQQFPYMQQTQTVPPMSQQGFSPSNFRMGGQQQVGKQAGQQLQQQQQQQQQLHHAANSSSYKFPTQMMQTRALYPSPQSFYLPQKGPHNSASSPQQHMSPQQFAQSSNTSRSNSSQGNPSNEKRNSKDNIFIPHQVLKNSKRPSDVDREIKEIIGIKTDDSRPAVPVVLMKDEKPPSIDIVNKLLNTASLSDDDKLKSLIGIPPCVNVSVNVNVNKAAGSEANVPGIKPAQPSPRASKQATNKQPILTKSNPSPVPKQQLLNKTPSSTPPPPQQTPSTSSAEAPSAPSPQPKKQQILLAPSFFGPKKK